MPLRERGPWWRGCVGYEVYVRSFADSDGDGVGDLAGLRERLDYLAWLGIDLIWITPFFPSPMHDHGYDVADYRGVDPVYGTLADFDRLLEDAHGLGMRVLIDLVPNHTSHEHPWFKEARASRDSPYRSYYVWRDPAPGGGPPNNWVSHFGGPAWTLDERSGQYWLHLFLPEQPDLNWADPRVADEFDRILRVWLERGVDGFRIDVARGLVKHADLPDNPLIAPGRVVAGPGNASAWASQEHLYDLDQPRVLEVYRRWRKIVEPYGALLVGEVYVLEPEALARYVRDQDGLHLSFWFKPLEMRWEPAAVRAALTSALAATDHLAWVQGSHDRPRAVTRLGGGRFGRARSLALATLLAGLPGVPFVYQGEELGLEDGLVPAAEAQDPISKRAGEHALGRDGCRTPMPWEPGPGLGFTAAERAWLPFGERADADTVAVQRADPSSTLCRYRRLLRVRRGLRDLAGAPLEWLGKAGPIVAYRRGSVIVAANCGDETASFEPPSGRWRVLYHAARSGEGAAGGAVVLEPCGAVLLGER